MLTMFKKLRAAWPASKGSNTTHVPMDWHVQSLTRRSA